MERTPSPKMSKTEALQLSNVLNIPLVVKDFEHKRDPLLRLTEQQKKIGALAVSQLRSSSAIDVAGNVALDLSKEETEAVIHVAQVALDDPRRVMFSLIAGDLDDDMYHHYEARGDAFRSLAAAADFVTLSREAGRP